MLLNMGKGKRNSVRFVPQTEERTAINIAPEAKDALRALLIQNERLQAVGYSEFINRAVEVFDDAGWERLTVWLADPSTNPPLSDIRRLLSVVRPHEPAPVKKAPVAAPCPDRSRRSLLAD